MFNLQLIDIIILFILLCGAFAGYRNGFIKSVVSFVGFIIVLVLAFTLKNPLSEFLYMHFPFMSFGGAYANITIVNILIYEAIAFIALVLVFSVLLKLIVVFTGILEKIASLNTVLGFFSKILGLVFGIVKTYLIIFAVFFVLHASPQINAFIEEGAISSKIASSTPVLSDLSKNDRDALAEIVEIQKKCKVVTEEESTKCNQDSLEILLKRGILKPEVAKKLVDAKKIKIDGAEEIINKYQKKNA